MAVKWTLLRCDVLHNMLAAEITRVLTMPFFSFIDYVEKATGYSEEAKLTKINGMYYKLLLALYSTKLNREVDSKLWMSLWGGMIRKLKTQ